MAALDLALVVDCAALAPSVHNTQPWRFVTTETGLEIRADETRQLGYLDPDGRMVRISCGAAIEFARLAVRAAGHECTVALLPEPEDCGLLARLTIGEYREPTLIENALVEAMTRRYTDRGPYDGLQVPHELIAELRRGIEQYGVWLAAVTEPADRVALAIVLTEAEEAEAMNPGYAAELARWVHVGDDGVPPPAAAGWPDEVVGDLPLRTFAPGAEPLHPGPQTPPKVLRDTVLVLGTDGDGHHDWLAAGAAFAWVELRATVEHLAMQPLGPATDFPAARARLRRDLRLRGEPQLVVRVGYGSRRPTTGRRMSGEILEGARAAH